MVNLITCLSGNLANISGCTKLHRLSAIKSNLTGDLSDLAPLTALTILNLGNSINITGSLSDLAPLTALTDLNLGNTRNFTGDIKDIRQPLKSLNVYNTKITGELIEFVKTQRAQGRITGSCIGIWGAVITFNGIGNLGWTDKTLTWTENTITLGDVTVNQ